MTSFYPIFNDDPIFGDKLIKKSCPAKSDICGNLPGVSVLDNFLIPKCNDINFRFSLSPEDSPNGCCVVESSNNTCDTYIPDSPDVTSEDYDMGIQFLDANNLNPRKICHSAPIRKRVLKIQDFFITILISAAVIFLTAIVGSCYEFWLKYGAGLRNSDSTQLIYENKCNKSISPIEYAFPSSMNEYPYKSCGDNTKMGFPYSIITYFNVKKRETQTQGQAQKETEHFGYKFMKLYGLPIKSFCLNFLYTLLFSRKFLNYILTTLSRSYATIESSFLKNIIFLFLTGIAFSVIAKYTGIQQFNSGTTFVLYILAMVIVFAMMFATFVTHFILYWFPEYYNKYEKTESPDKPILTKDFALYNNVLYYITRERLDKGAGFVKKLKNINIMNIILNVCLVLIAIIPFLICLITGYLGSMIGTLYMLFSLVYNIFAVPLSNIEAFLTIIKDHGELLTILFCISVLLSSLDSLDSTTSGIIGGLVGLIILYTFLL
jgi:hypothetical protein